MAASPRAGAQVGTTGAIAEVANPVRVRLDAATEIPLGATVYTYRTVPTSSGDVGVLSGTYSVVRQSGADLFVEISGGGGSAPAVGHRVEVEASGASSSVRIESDPSGASVSLSGYPLGVTPLRLDVEPGTRTFVLAQPGYEPASLELAVQERELMTVLQTLSRPPPAAQLFATGDAAFRSGDYDGAEALLTRAAQNSDASLTAAQTADLPSLVFAARIGSDLSTRAAQLGLPSTELRTAVSKIVFIHKNQSNLAVARSALADLEAILDADPAMVAVRALVPAPAPASSRP